MVILLHVNVSIISTSIGIFKAIPCLQQTMAVSSATITLHDLHHLNHTVAISYPTSQMLSCPFIVLLSMAYSFQAFPYVHYSACHSQISRAHFING